MRGFEYSVRVPSNRAVDEQRLGTWVFKCNPRVNDLPARVVGGETVIDNWCVADNYRSKMIRAGQKVILWVSGAKTGPMPRGVWGVGWTTGERFDAGGRQTASVDWKVPIAIRAFDDGPLESDAVAAIPELARLEVFTSPQQANPSWVSKEQLAALDKLLPDWRSLAALERRLPSGTAENEQMAAKSADFSTISS